MIVGFVFFTPVWRVIEHPLGGVLPITSSGFV
jgi:hypothetical protein